MSQTRTVKMVEQKVVVRVTCDACGKTSDPNPDGWHHFSSYHGDWGNDSVDSHDDHDACSFACYLSIVRKMFDDYAPADFDGRGATLEVDGKDWWFLRDMLAHAAVIV